MELFALQMNMGQSAAVTQLWHWWPVKASSQQNPRVSTVQANQTNRDWQTARISKLGDNIDRTSGHRESLWILICASHHTISFSFCFPSSCHSAQWDAVWSTAMTQKGTWAGDPHQIGASNGTSDHEHRHALWLSVTLSIGHWRRSRWCKSYINERVRCTEWTWIWSRCSCRVDDSTQTQCHRRELVEGWSRIFLREIWSLSECLWLRVYSEKQIECRLILFEDR